MVNGAPASKENQLATVGNMEAIAGKTGDEAATGSLNPFKFLSLIGDPRSRIKLWKNASFDDNGGRVTVYYPVFAAGNKILRPGQRFKVEGTATDRIDFLSLMLALFLGTAALPHILIRYYTVPSPAAARKSTIVAIAAIGFFYILTLFMGLGAMTNGVVNLLDDNMSAPLLARSFGTFLFSMISAIAFATVLGTVSGLIIAASGAVAHDLLDRYAKVIKNDKQKVAAGKVVAFAVGALAIVLGILFKGVNVTFLVGLAFAVAASANLPVHRHDALLEADDRARHHGLHLRRRVLFDRPDPVLADDVRALRQGPADGALPPEEPGDRLDPAELPDARSSSRSSPGRRPQKGRPRPSERQE